MDPRDRGAADGERIDALQSAAIVESEPRSVATGLATPATGAHQARRRDDPLAHAGVDDLDALLRDLLEHDEVIELPVQDRSARQSLRSRHAPG